MIVGVSGFGSTGSGAVMDYLREFEEVSAGENMELSFLYDPDGVLELEHRLALQPIRYYSGDAGIKRFQDIIYSYDLTRYVRRFMSVKTFRKISDDYINDLIEMKWEGGLWHFDRRRVGRIEYLFKYWFGGKCLRIFDKLHKEQPQKFFDHRMYIPVHGEKFYASTRKYTSRLIDAMCNTSKQIIALDQPFPSNDPVSCFKFFNQVCKAIIVTRDPRDVYLISKKLSCGWEMRFTPQYDVNDFITYYRDQMDLIKPFPESVLFLHFEDLIYKYDETAKIINEFVGIEKHLYPKKHFDPKISIANTQLHLRYPEAAGDIACIERKLAEYLYPFDRSKADLESKTWVFK